MAAYTQHTSGTYHGMFERAEGVNIVNSTLVSGNIATTNGRKSPFDILKEAVAHTAFHDSAARYDPPKCHPNTRLAVLDKILRWVLRSDRETRESFIMWLTGAAGAGKSAIMQSFIEQCLRNKIPMSIASFFFGRSDASRNHAGPLIATLAYQIYRHLALSAQNTMLSIIDADPLIFTRNLDRQLTDLIVAPLQSARGLRDLYPSECHFLIAIDGLDECLDREAQKKILRVISGAIQEFKLPFLFLVASRPEHDIKIAFDSRQMDGIYTRLYLDDTFRPEEDIRTFIQDSFNEIKTSHPFKSTLPSHWPVPEITNALVQKSSGQFVYAATAVRYVKSSRHQPHRRLETVMNLRPPQGDLPFAQLDALYDMILSSAEDKKQVLYALSVYSHRVFEDYFNISEFMSLETGELEVLFCDLGSLVSIELGGLKILHASLHDFLLDPTRSGNNFIGIGDYRERHLINILGYLSAAPCSDILEQRALSSNGFSIEHFAAYKGQSEMLIEKASSFPLADFFPLFDTPGSQMVGTATFLIHGWLPFLSRMGRLHNHWSSIQKDQEILLDKMFLYFMDIHYSRSYIKSWICLFIHVGTDRLVPAWSPSSWSALSKGLITDFNGPLYGGEGSQYDPLWFRFIDIEEIDPVAADMDTHRYRRCLARFLKEETRSGIYVLGPDTYREATLFFIRQLNAGMSLNKIQESLSDKEVMEACKKLPVLRSLIRTKMWILDVPDARPTPGNYNIEDFVNDTILALGYIAFFFPLSGWSQELFDNCQRQALPPVLMELFPIHSDDLRREMARYVERFKAKSYSMRSKHSSTALVLDSRINMPTRPTSEEIKGHIHESLSRRNCQVSTRTHDLGAHNDGGKGQLDGRSLNESLQRDKFDKIPRESDDEDKPESSQQENSLPTLPDIVGERFTNKLLGPTHKQPSFLGSPDLISRTDTTVASPDVLVHGNEGNIILPIAAPEALLDVQPPPVTLRTRRRRCFLRRIFEKKPNKVVK